MHHPIKLIYAALIITLVGVGVAFGLLRHQQKIEQQSVVDIQSMSQWIGSWEMTDTPSAFPVQTSADRSFRSSGNFVRG